MPLLKHILPMVMLCMHLSIADGIVANVFIAGHT